jgi:hypothetical protein
MLELREAIGAAADTLVQELDPALAVIDAIHALRPPQPQLALVRRRAEEIEELAGLDGQRPGRGIDDEVLVLCVDPLVRDDRTERFLCRDTGLLRRRTAFAHDVRR